MSEKNLVEGNFAPDFTLDIENQANFTLSENRGKKNVVLYFYPKDDTPGCTLEAKNFAENISKFEKLDTIIIGISKDSLESHEKFRTKYCLPFSLASDANSTVCEAYGTWVEKNMYGKKYWGIQRDTFLIDKTGKIRKIWRKVKVENHCDEVLEAVKKL
ncbi:MAG: thioredoxin-dependent thiol peroxidase [Rickettsiales bacterium]|nr:thioredoxin-dependent thiol peroxidase [Rickettsiales bacterium]